MNPAEQRNPYAAPAARIDDFDRSATWAAPRGTRLLAALIDGGMWFIPYVLVLFTSGILRRGGEPPNQGVLAFFGFYAVVVAVIDLVLVFQTQQTIGKKLMGIRIVRFDGSACNPWRILFLRGFVTGLLKAIPLLGYVVTLVDPLLIFREDNRCMHDHLADTIVVRA